MFQTKILGGGNGGGPTSWGKWEKTGQVISSKVTIEKTGDPAKRGSEGNKNKKGSVARKGTKRKITGIRRLNDEARG